ncbi:hypothetical protein HK098_006056 [Nowakowskiella sp. JEL0407]|nr:hypothetical protein HK098_006056 [Nowakowskiella sp. JEL0407]
MLQIRDSAVYSSMINIPQACVGREEVLDSISRHFSDTSQSAAAIIFGRPGMGKTTVATKFVSKVKKSRRSAYTHILWISFESDFTFQSSIKDCMVKGKQQLLILFDNADDPDLVKQCVKKLTQINGHVLITTRNRAIDNHIRLGIDIKKRTRIELLVWTEPVTREYISSRLDCASMDSEDEESLNKILEVIDGYPLVVEQMCSYMTTLSGCTFTSYYQKLMAKRLEIYSQVPLLGYSDYHKTLDMTIRSIGCVMNKNIPRSYLRRYPIQAGIYFNVDVYLIRRTLDSSDFIHELFHAVAVSALYAEFPEYINNGCETSTLGLGSALLPHIVELNSISPKYSQNSDLALLLYNTGYFAFYMGSYSIARILFISAREIYSNLNESVSLAYTIHYLGEIAKLDGNYETAKTLYMECLDIQANEDVARTLTVLGNVAVAKGDYKEAEKLYAESLEIKETVYKTRQHDEVADTIGRLGDIANQKVYGTRQHTAVAITLTDLGDVAFSRGEHKEAEKLFTESLKIYETPSCLVITRPRRFCILNVLKFLKKYSEHGDFIKSKDLISESITILTSIYGTHRHRDVAISKNELGNVARKKRDYVEAEKLYTTLSRFEHNIEAAPATNNLGIVRRQQREFEQALALHKESLEVYRKFLGDLDNPDIAKTVFSLGGTYEAMGDFERAKEKYEESLRMLAKVFDDPTHPLSLKVSEALELLKAKTFSMEKVSEPAPQSFSAVTSKSAKAN